MGALNIITINSAFFTLKLKRLILEESHEGKVKVRMYLGSGSSLQDVLLDTTMRGLFFQDTESDINLASRFYSLVKYMHIL